MNEDEFLALLDAYHCGEITEAEWRRHTILLRHEHDEYRRCNALKAKLITYWLIS